jgi:hypothetical protein
LGRGRGYHRVYFYQIAALFFETMYRTTTTYAGTFETFIMAARSTTYDYMHDSHRSYICSIEGWREDRRSVKIWFRKVVNGQPVDSLGLDPKSISTSSTLDALEKCMDLAIDICCGNDPVSICAVQDTFFALVGLIPNNHRLRSLAVTITVVLPNDYAASIFLKSVDVSCYGYNESDTKLAEYRSDPEGYVLRKANLESKRKQARGQDA